MNVLHLPSPAKINHCLHVVGRRADGYHLLQTVFQFIDFYDELTFSLIQEPKIELESLLDFPAEQNLITKAAYLLQTKTDCNQGIKITLNKRIPLGAGLGGGSSNAATTLLALNYLWNLNLSLQELLELGVTLGADIPIFLYGQASFAEGIGERLQPIDLEDSWVLLLFPDCQVETRKIFSDSELTRNTPGITITEFLHKGGHNDCEPVAKKYYPEIAQALDYLGQFAMAKMTGSGSCVFATFKDRATALKVANKIPAAFNGIIVRGLNTSPLHSTFGKIIGVSPSGKAQGFDPCIPRFES